MEGLLHLFLLDFLEKGLLMVHYLNHLLWMNMFLHHPNLHLPHLQMVHLLFVHLHLQQML
jgi:hypothetical protein|tara:strand:- start:104 stop:283 length:180 start_codon:yes stop_codon:yes gene_type:complete